MATIEVTIAQDGTSVDAQVGDTILLRLSDNPTTGYRRGLEAVTGESMVQKQRRSVAVSPGTWFAKRRRRDG